MIIKRKTHLVRIVRNGLVEGIYPNNRNRGRNDLQRGHENDSERNELRQRSSDEMRGTRIHTTVFDEEDAYLSYGKMKVECSECGALQISLERIQNSSDRNPVFTNCCRNGNIKLLRMHYPPQRFRELSEGNSKLQSSF